jgi:hypothetical protein
VTRAEYVAEHGCEPHDVTFWGPGGVNVGRWGNECRRGCAYKDVGVTKAGAPNQRRSISSGRKARGYASGTDGRL